MFTQDQEADSQVEAVEQAARSRDTGRILRQLVGNYPIGGSSGAAGTQEDEE